MFDSLTETLSSVFRNLRGYGTLTEANVAEALAGVRTALLEADVHAQVAEDFLARVKIKALGQETLKSVTPGQQVIKIISDELTALLGEKNQPLHLSATPALVMLVGLQGSGKTTTAGKLAKQLSAKRCPLLVACDPRRPAAMDQLETLGRQISIPVFAIRDEPDVLEICAAALEAARAQNRDLLIFDTAGRLQVDEPLMQELVKMKKLLGPQEILLVADAATGQQAVSIAGHFDRALGLTGIILTKLDGDARGGAAVSMLAVTGKPIKLVGVGERMDQLEPFHPDRMASRILGMGDVVSLVEKAQEAVEEKEARKLEEKLRKQELTLEDFLEQLRHLKKMGSLSDLVAMIPGAGSLKNTHVDDRQLKRQEAIVLSMTREERRKPEILNASRRARIARGSGTSVAEVNTLIQNFGLMRKMMKTMALGGKRMPSLQDLAAMRKGVGRSAPKRLKFR